MSGKRWARLFECAARYPDGPRGAPEILLPDGTRVGPGDAGARLSAWLGHDVELVPATAGDMQAYAMAIQTIEDIEAGADQLALATADGLCPPGSFHDATPLHLLTDASLAALAARYPEGRVDIRRFRPNVLIETGASPGTVEEGWVGRTLALGAEVRAAVLMPTIRCVMTTLAQEDLPRDPRILRTVARDFGGNVGVYGTVAAPGRVRVGDVVTLL